MPRICFATKAPGIVRTRDAGPFGHIGFQLANPVGVVEVMVAIATLCRGNPSIGFDKGIDGWQRETDVNDSLGRIVVFRRQLNDGLIFFRSERTQLGAFDEGGSRGKRDVNGLRGEVEMIPFGQKCLIAVSVNPQIGVPIDWISGPARLKKEEKEKKNGKEHRVVGFAKR